jgi:hypothetical protein
MARNEDAELRRLLDEEAEHSEATKDDPIPASALAKDQGVAASTLVRGWIVRQLAAEHAGAADTAAMLDRLETDVRVLRKLVASRPARRDGYGSAKFLGFRFSGGFANPHASIADR